SQLNVLISSLMVPSGGYSRSQLTERRAQMDELLSKTVRLGDNDLLERVLQTDLYYSTELGDRARLVRALGDLAALGDARERQLARWVARHAKAMLAVLDGDFPGAEKLAEEAFEIGQNTAGEHVEGIYGMQMFTIRREQDRLAEVAPIIKRFVDESPDQSVWRPGFALIACDLGFRDSARRSLAQLDELGFAFSYDAKRSTSLA